MNHGGLGPWGYIDFILYDVMMPADKVLFGWMDEMQSLTPTWQDYHLRLVESEAEIQHDLEMLKQYGFPTDQLKSASYHFKSRQFALKFRNASTQTKTPEKLPAAIKQACMSFKWMDNLPQREKFKHHFESIQEVPTEYSKWKDYECKDALKLTYVGCVEWKQYHSMQSQFPENMKMSEEYIALMMNLPLTKNTSKVDATCISFKCEVEPVLLPDMIYGPPTEDKKDEKESKKDEKGSLTLAKHFAEQRHIYVECFMKGESFFFFWFYFFWDLFLFFLCFFFVVL